ncbi:MAG: hypothetical protein RL699_580 [Bacteroidota bacterium]|jgi:O-antigen/teichoic acid export membrane protein
MFKKLVEQIKNQKQLSNLLIYGLGQGFNLITPLLVIPYIVSVCGLANYGKISLGMAISFFIMVFIDYGSDIYGVKTAAIHRNKPEELQRLFVTTYAAKFLLLIGIVVLFAGLILLLPFFRTEKALFFLGIPVLVGQFLNPTWFLQGVENFKWITISTMVSKLIYLGGISVFIHSTADYVYINLLWGLGMILANGCTLIYVYKKHAFSFAHLELREVKQLLRTNFSIFSSQIFVSLQMYAPIMIIAWFGTASMAGQYKIIEQIIVVFKTYIFLFFNFVYPRVCYLIEKSEIAAFKFWKTYNGLNFVFIGSSMFLLYWFAVPAVTYFSKTDIELSAHLLRVAIWIPVLLAISIPLKQLVLGFNLEKKYTQITTITVLINLLLMVLLLPYFQIYGVLYTLIFTEILTLLGFVYFLKHRLKPKAI